MKTSLTQSEEQVFDKSLNTLAAAGIVFAYQIERDDIVDELIDHIDSFQRRPLSTLVSLSDPYGAPLLDGVWWDTAPGSRRTLADIRVLASELALAAGTQLTEFVAFPDADSTDSGSLRLRTGIWDVADVDFDLSSLIDDSDSVILDLIEAIIPTGVTAMTFEAVTVFFSPGPDGNAAAKALSAELEAM